MTKRENSIPLSLYVHIPWCIKKCPYCDFNSHEIQNTLPEDQYIDALILDLKSHAKEAQDRDINSVFIGGGTPSIFTAKNIKRLIDAIRNELNLNPTAEITIEANPGTTDQENFSGFRAAGVNRISIGVQSFTNTQLKKLGRIHDAQNAINAVNIAKQAGFENINIDLMYALPQQNLTTALHDIEQAIRLNPTHISYYQLTIEPNTSFYRQPPRLPDNQESWEIQQSGMELLANHGYQQYEVSAYAKDDFQCMHNTNYWQFGDYLGIGAGAHQKLTQQSSTMHEPNSITRCEKPKHPQQYMRYINEGKPSLGTHTLIEEDIIFEFMLNALRLKHGFTKQQFELHTGLPIEIINEPLQSHISEGLLVITNDNIHCSGRGYRFLDDVLQNWLPQATTT
ncbi:MAG: radical SAM family heme chaperone HemW [Gammaproteobacteria bacterium]|nr:MAG: radical SAM family heme chaperone HemW [Gammaproteobacteria bacterium]